MKRRFRNLWIILLLLGVMPFVACLDASGGVVEPPYEVEVTDLPGDNFMLVYGNITFTGNFTDYVHRALTSAHGSTGNIVGENNTQVLTNKTLDASVAKGTWTKSGTWVIPSVSFGGELFLNGQQLRLGAISLVMNSTGSAKGIDVRITNAGAEGIRNSYSHYSTSPADGDSIYAEYWNARDSGLNEVRYGYFLITSHDVTDGSENGQAYWFLMNDGNTNNCMYLSSNGTLYIDESYQTFDEKDDAKLLEKGIKEGDKEALEAVGVYSKKYKRNEDGTFFKDRDGDLVQEGNFINTQPFLKLLAGGVYQNRGRIDDLEARIVELEARLAKLEKE